MQLRRVLKASAPALALTAIYGLRAAAAGGFGISGLDTTLAAVDEGVVGLGMTVGGVGLVGYVGSLMDNPFSTILSGSVNFVTKGGMLGGGSAFLSMMGLGDGATF